MTGAGMAAPRSAGIALATILLMLITVLAITTPWRPLPEAGSGGAVAAAPLRDFSAAQIEREDRYHRQIRPPAYASLVLGLLVAAALGLTTAGARLIELAGRPLGGGWVAQVVLGGLALLLVTRLATVPLSVWAEVVRRRYGLSTREWSGWALDWLRGLAVSGLLLALVALLLFALIRWRPGSWWVPGAVGGAALVIILSFAYPLVVEPVFNRFTPLPAGQLRTELLDMAERDGVAVDEVLVADASRRTSALNAYVSGFGSTRRIVVYDTLLSSATPAEVRLIVAHELGHARRNDVLHGTLLGALALAGGVCALFLLLSCQPLLRRAGVAEPADPRALALVLLLAAVGGQIAGPVQSLVSRRIEARADVHSLELTRDPSTFVSSHRRLALTNLSDLNPHPLVYGLFATHPTAPERIALARTWSRAAGMPEPPSTSRREPMNGTEPVADAAPDVDPGGASGSAPGGASGSAPGGASDGAPDSTSDWAPGRGRDD